MGFPHMGLRNFNKLEADTAQKRLERVSQVLDGYFLAETFFVADRITQADVAVASALYLAYKMVLDRTWQCRFANVTRWFKTIVNQPEFRRELNLQEADIEVPLCQETPKFNQKVYEEMKKKWESPQQNEQADQPPEKPKTAAQLKKEAKK